MAKKKEAPLENVRIIGIFAHVDAENDDVRVDFVLHRADSPRRSHRRGTIRRWTYAAGERGITIICPAATACHWRGHRINLIDTPGRIDFTAEVVRSIRVIDGAVMIAMRCRWGGARPKRVWLHANREKLARLIFVNKLDRIGSDFYRVLGEVHEH